ncbi:MAG TPA: DUF6134 family protein [Rhizomicrobium sp.]|jgi:hypothetical protein|nr:DUF6134 family protein [Rhizomicrobium sp.]
MPATEERLKRFLFGGLMMEYRLIGVAALLAAFVSPAQADPNAGSMSFAVMRNGAQIGTNRIKVGHDGEDTTVQSVTHVAVNIGFLTLYKYDQTETERWADGHFIAMNSKTDDNGTEHNASAKAKDGKIVIHGDDKVSEAPVTAVPLSLWNASVVDTDVAVDTKDGTVQPLKVVDRGEENVVVQGRARPAHHYELVTKFPQDVWYDESGQLVQVELKGSDGSTIRYQLM